MNDGGIAEFQNADSLQVSFGDDGLDHKGDVLIELRNPEGILKLIQVAEQGTFFILLKNEKLLHLLMRLDGLKSMLRHQFPG